MSAKSDFTRIVISVLLGLALIAKATARQTAFARPLPASDASDRQAAYQEVESHLSTRQRREYGFLTEWPVHRLRRLEVWLTLGITFEGEWTSEELDAVLRVLDAFGALYGERRFFELTDAALELHGDRGERHLRIVKAPEVAIPPGAWYGKSGRIVINSGAFDDGFLKERYYFRFMKGAFAQPGPEVTRREIVIGHEFGHVLLDGLRVEAGKAAGGATSFESLYRHTIPVRHWPHSYAKTKENLVTELALWALDVGRTAEVHALRTELLEATISSSDWPRAAAPRFATVSADRAR